MVSVVPFKLSFLFFLGGGEKCTTACPVGYQRCETCPNPSLSAACYPNLYKCDFDNDCSDGSDERNCSMYYIIIMVHSG